MDYVHFIETTLMTNVAAAIAAASPDYAGGGCLVCRGKQNMQMRVDFHHGQQQKVRMPGFLLPGSIVQDSPAMSMLYGYEPKVTPFIIRSRIHAWRGR